ncbi:MAG: DUF485 domain-containing protein [Labilithrix sp.]|nr:DUF485 domain-containing protein [Labilithrix sp.]MCW5832854.1 DUF485 domain-containing protein [Labilithrix sp.]
MREERGKGPAEPADGRGARAGAAHDRLAALSARRWRVAIALTAAMMATYFGFLFLVAYAKPAAGALIAPGLSWGILLGALVIVVAWVVTGVYVVWANARYDVELEAIRSSARGER